MLKQLRITNIVLIESAEIAFAAGLNVISGETGAGKSAVMNALGLIAGDRADAGMIRHGSDKGVVEVVFDIDTLPSVHQLLEQRGIDHNIGDELIIRREIGVTSKSRAFINNQMAQLGLLREVGELLVDIVGQHANQRLLSIEKHREILDIYGELTQESAIVSKNWATEQAQRAKLDELIKTESQRVRDIEVCEMELAELQEASIKENEEEELFAEYTLLANSEELSGKVNEITETLSGERHAVLPLLSRHRNTLEQLVRIDSSFADMSTAFDGALIELQEISHSLTQYQSRIEYNPARLADINERLSLINRLKRKYGSSVEEIRAYQAKASEKLTRLQNADDEIEDLKKALGALEELNKQLCATLSKQRSEAAAKLEKAVVKQLRALNMPKVAFHCEIREQTRNQHGNDRIEFFLSPNIGERQIPIKECASGGELSRVMLALQTLLAGKENTPTLVFDEIDANIGGETASVVGEQLNEIGKKHQVLCITHFPQVAKQALHHIQISKQEKKGRTHTVVKVLDESSRHEELARMLGGEGSKGT